MTKDEALGLALEALQDYVDEYGPWSDDSGARYVLRVGREALAQSEPVAFSCLRCVTPKKCAIHGCSPNTWPSETQPQPWEKFCDSNCVWTDHHPDCKLAQRTWVGLTDEEIDQGLLRSDYAFKTAEAWHAGVVFAMTKLKEKNT